MEHVYKVNVQEDVARQTLGCASASKKTTDSSLILYEADRCEIKPQYRYITILIFNFRFPVRRVVCKAVGSIMSYSTSNV
uniref:Ovule protein n=1 Tax=Steinernema glaseri TaxID=37863 RepID=A0A1I7YRS5_9BILA